MVNLMTHYYSAMLRKKWNSENRKLYDHTEGGKSYSKKVAISSLIHEGEPVFNR